MMRRWNYRASRQRGFTLIELVVVMSIIAILFAAAAVQVKNRIKMGFRTRVIADISAFELALDLYEIDNGDPPSTQQGLQALVTEPSTDPLPRNWNGPYLKKKVPLDPWLNEYVYRFPGQLNPDSYDLISYAKDGQPGGAGEWDMDLTNE